MLPQELYHEYRCKGCEKLLFKGVLVDSEVEVKCKRCGRVETIVGVSKDKLVCLKYPCLNRVAVAENKIPA
jgi:phage FluMu protein Com